MDVKEEDLLSDVTSQNESELFMKKTNSDRVLLKKDYDVMIKTEIKSDSPFPDCSSQKERACSSSPLIDQINFEHFSCSNNCKTEFRTEIGLEKERELFLEDTVVKDNSNNETHNKTEVKEETCWLETEISTAYDNINDGSFTPVKSPRLYIKSVCSDSSSDSSLPSTEAAMKNTSSSFGKDHLEFESQKSDVSEILATEKYVHPEQSDKYSYGETCRTLLLDKDNEACKFNNCEKAFTHKEHNLNDEGKRTHKCVICEKRFTRLCDLRKHTLIHEGKRIHKCEICEKRFILMSNLRQHSLIHEDKRDHKCGVCEKRFTRLSHLKRHNLIHEGTKPYKCEICQKGFTRLCDLKSHVLIHEGIKLYKCEICEKGFTHLRNLQSHILIHEDIKPHKCEICKKGFTYMHNLQSHILIHEGIKPYKCEICDKRFTVLSTLKTHKLLHEGEKPHKCEICQKRFAQLSSLKRHNVVHGTIKPYSCEICGIRFTQLSSMKRHYSRHNVTKPHK